jgi:hypothetical protein
VFKKFAGGALKKLSPQLYHSAKLLRIFGVFGNDHQLNDETFEIVYAEFMSDIEVILSQEKHLKKSLIYFTFLTKALLLSAKASRARNVSSDQLMLEALSLLERVRPELEKEGEGNQDTLAICYITTAFCKLGTIDGSRRDSDLKRLL